MSTDTALWRNARWDRLEIPPPDPWFHWYWRRSRQNFRPGPASHGSDHFIRGGHGPSACQWRGRSAAPPSPGATPFARFSRRRTSPPKCLKQRRRVRRPRKRSTSVNRAREVIVGARGWPHPARSILGPPFPRGPRISPQALPWAHTAASDGTASLRPRPSPPAPAV